MDIHKGLGNANKIMNRLLSYTFAKYHLKISSIDGGSLRNAIPRESRTIIGIDEKRSQDFEKDFEILVGVIKNELRLVEPNLKISYEKVDLPLKAINSEAQEKLLKSIYAALNLSLIHI